jgi:hypothetical protein
VHDVTDAIAAAHARTTRGLEARVVGARQRFVELLVAGDLDGVEIERLGHTLGFADDRPFRVAVLRGGADDHDALELQRRVDELGGRHAVVARGTLVVIVWQGAAPDEVVATARELAPDATIGVGSARSGLRGARASLVDAELTVEVTVEREVGTFDDAWLWATLTASGTGCGPSSRVVPPSPRRTHTSRRPSGRSASTASRSRMRPATSGSTPTRSATGSTAGRA